jgi:hypothetical protein
MARTHRAFFNSCKATDGHDDKDDLDEDYKENDENEAFLDNKQRVGGYATGRGGDRYCDVLGCWTESPAWSEFGIIHLFSLRSDLTSAYIQGLEIFLT